MQECPITKETDLNTPTHAVVNLSLLGKKYPPLPVLGGAILPDLPIYLFYFWEKTVVGSAESAIWSIDYFKSSWQPVMDLLHSFPLILILFVLARYLRRLSLEAFSASLFFHSLLDFPFHHDDAHRHFFPFSDYRFRSPVSYWDAHYHGTAGAAIEMALMLAAALELYRRHRSWMVRCALVLLSFFYATAYFALYVRG